MNSTGALANRQTRSARVLVVDDEEDIRNLVGFNLRTAGMNVTFAENGAEAVACIKADKPDLVVLDLMLPELDGISVCEMIRNVPECADLPVIMLTAWATERARIVGLQAGANDYITKPFSPRELVKRVQSLLAEYDLKRRQGGTMELKQLSIDLEQRQVSANGRQVNLSTEEFRMLSLLVEAIFQRLEKNDTTRP